MIQIRTTTRVNRSWPKRPTTGAAATTQVNNGALNVTASAKSADVTPTDSMNNDYAIGRINFGPRDSFTTLGQLIDEIGAQEELVDDLCLFAGDLLTELEAMRDGVLETYEL